MNRIVPLEMMVQGEEGEVVDVDGRPELVTRLKEMGLREGTHIRMLLPGKPCIVGLGDHRLSFRAEEAAIVLVEINAEKT